MILHIDMDAFFASVEQLDKPELKGKCVIVGGRSNRGVVTAASYEARNFGVHAAMPMYQAKEKCPNAIIIPGRMARYKEISKKIMSLLKDFTPLIEQVSIDEAYLDIAGCERLHGKPEEMAHKIKKRIRDTVNLACSIGIAPTKFLAKIASDINKPDGLFIILPENVMEFIEDLPIRKVPGVGKVMHEQLDLMGIKTLGDVKKYSDRMLIKKLGRYGHRLIELSGNIDKSAITPSSVAKSVSSETTLPVNADDKALLKKYLLIQAEDVGRQLRESGLKAKTVTLKVKHNDFKQVTRRTSLVNPTQSSETIYKTAKRLLDEYTIRKKVRLIGVGTSGLVSIDMPEQIELFADLTTDPKKEDANWEKVDETVDSIIRKFGKDAIRKASTSEDC